MSMDTRRGEEGDEAVEQLQGGEDDDGAPLGIGRRQGVDDGLGVEEAETTDGEGGAGGMTGEALEGQAVPPFHPQGSVEGEAAVIIPAGHFGGHLIIDQILADEVAEDAPAELLREPVEVLVAEMGSSSGSASRRAAR
jgi:hypothetical protein